MGIFDKFKNKNNDFEIKCEETAIELIEMYMKETNISFENVTELERQILVVYCFGMADGLRQNLKARNNTKDIINIIINVYIKVFKYSQEQAEQFFDFIIDDLQSKIPEKKQSAIIHRGLEGYFAWEKDDKNSVLKDVCKIINELKG